MRRPAGVLGLDRGARVDYRWPMREGGIAVADRRPPAAVVRVLNPLLRTLLMSPAARVASVPLTVLRFSGRKSGHEYRIVVGWYELDGSHVVFTPARWRLNFRGTAPLCVAARGRWRQGTGTLVEDPEVVAAALQRVLDDGASPTELGLRVARGHRITADDVRASGRAMIRLELEGEERRGTTAGR